MRCRSNCSKTACRGSRARLQRFVIFGALESFNFKDAKPCNTPELSFRVLRPVICNPRSRRHRQFLRKHRSHVRHLRVDPACRCRGLRARTKRALGTAGAHQANAVPSISLRAFPPRDRKILSASWVGREWIASGCAVGSRLSCSPFPQRDGQSPSSLLLILLETFSDTIATHPFEGCESRISFSNVVSSRSLGAARPPPRRDAARQPPRRCPHGRTASISARFRPAR